MKLYTTELIGITTVSENIIALDKLRTMYGEPKRDDRGSYWDVDDEVVSCLPQGTTFSGVREGRQD